MAAAFSRTHSRRPSLIHWIQYFLLYPGVAAIRALPRSLHLPLSRVIARIWHYLFPLRKKVVLHNLALAFPEKPPIWHRDIAVSCAEHFARMTFEFAALQKASPEELRRLVGRVEGFEYIESALREHHAFIAVSGHLGNWELLVSYFAAVENLAVTVLAKPLHNPLGENIVAATRRQHGFEVVYTGKDIRPVLKAARRNRILAFLADQDARRDGIFVPFLGTPASTFRGPALFARRWNLPILVATCCRNASDDRYHIRISPPIYPNAQTDRQKEVERLTRFHAAQLESAVRAHPEQYFWFHRRWKTRPRKAKKKRSHPVFPVSEKGR